MEEHVRRKLTSIVNRLEGGNRIRSHSDTFYYTIYAYGHEVALVFAALGLSHPLVAVLSDGASSDGRGAASAGVLFDSLQAYPMWLLALVALFVVFWILTRVTVNHRKLTEKVPLYRACSRELGKVESDLDATLSSSAPLAALSDLQVRIKEIVDKYYAADGWPWPIAPPNSGGAVSARIEQLCEQYRINWSEMPDVVQQREPVRAA